MTQIIAKEIFLISKNKPPERWFFNARAGREREILKGVFGIPGVSPGGCLVSPGAVLKAPQDE